MSIDVAPPANSTTSPFKLGTAKNPEGHELTADGISLLRDGQRWLPAMGEIHFSRVPANEWRDELLKMKAGGIGVVATYVFWIHHEEEQGKWNWSGERDLRKFIETCKEVGMPVVARIGPWCHGEVRNGGIPEWMMPLGRKLRSDDAEYIGHVKELYQQISQQLNGLLWKDGGPVVGIQLENESRNGRHLVNLKGIARDVGLDVPIYTRTGWPGLSPNSPVPYGEILPLYGAYAEGFWDKTMAYMPGNYWQAFVFRDERIDSNIAQDQQGTGRGEQQRYPYLTCELGGGMMTSYHRRILIDPMDVVSVAAVKIGSGSNMPGYYMYHGGTNPEGKLTTLMENQATSFTNDNDMPVKTYDFQAPLGEFGQVREHYHLLRELHMFVNDFGSELAPMDAYINPDRVKNGKDAETLRWSVRSDGVGGFLFVNNYQRLLPMAAREKTQFDVKLSGSTLTIPSTPITVPANNYFIWPFNQTLGGAKLIYATAQAICRVQDGDTTYVVFKESAGVAPEFLFDGTGVTVESTRGAQATADGKLRITGVPTGTDAAIRLATSGGKHLAIILLDEKTAETCWRVNVKGSERILLTRANVLQDGNKLRLQSANPADFSVAMLPVGPGLSMGSTQLSVSAEGAFQRFTLASPVNAKPQAAVSVELVKPAGPAREIKIGAKNVAVEPSDAEFEQAAVWKIKLPADVSPDRHLLLSTKYAGDAARYYFDGKFITDNFYNGTSFDLGLWRLGAGASDKELLVKVLPMKKDAAIYLNEPAKLDFANADSIAKVLGTQIIEMHECALNVN